MESFAHFEVGELPGVYRSQSTPGTPGDLDKKRKAGWGCYVLRLQFSGVYLPARILRTRPKVRGLIISTRMPEGCYQSWLIDPDDPGRMLIHALENATVWKERENGSLLLRGMEWDEGELNRWPQTWVCCANHTEIDMIVKGMTPWLEKRYLEVKRPPFPNNTP